jgi:hypothetical protein
MSVSPSTLKVLPVILLVVGLLIGAGGMYTYFQRQLAKNELLTVLNQVSRLMLVPEKEMPTLATVSDKEKLKDQPFFQNSQNGDKILIWSKAGKAVLYRPSLNKIIEVVNIDLNNSKDNESSPSPTNPSPSVTSNLPQKIRVAIYNGTPLPELSASASAKLEKSQLALEVVAKAEAAKKDYRQNLLINLTDLPAAMVREIAGLFEASISALPTGEKQPEKADLLLIIGEEFWR